VLFPQGRKALRPGQLAQTRVRGPDPVATRTSCAHRALPTRHGRDPSRKSGSRVFGLGLPARASADVYRRTQLPTKICMLPPCSEQPRLRQRKREAAYRPVPAGFPAAKAQESTATAGTSRETIREPGRLQHRVQARPWRRSPACAEPKSGGSGRSTVRTPGPRCAETALA